MAASVRDEETQQQEQCLLDRGFSNEEDEISNMQKALIQTFRGTAYLAKLLPTGTVLLFQLLSPVFTNQGHCNAANQYMTAFLVALCAILSFVLRFSDSFQDGAGTTRYGFATFKGLWVVDGSMVLDPVVAAKYKIRFVDFVHALTSVMVFVAVALFDKNVVSCYSPMASEETKQVIAALPVAIGVLGGAVFVAFPDNRHGISIPIPAYD